MQHPSAVSFTRLLFTASLTLGATACATAPTPGGASTAVGAQVVGGSGGMSRGMGLEITTRNEGAQSSFPTADAATVFAALEAAYTELRIPLTRKDDATKTIGNEGIKLRRQLGKIEMRKAFDCGGSSGMPNSETYTITAGIMTTVMDTPSKGATITTLIDASGENPNYPGSGVRCSSTGVIEEALAKDIRARLNARP